MPKKFTALLWQCCLVSIFSISVVWFWRVLNSLPDAKILASAPLSLATGNGVISMSASPRWDRSESAAAAYRGNVKCSNGYIVVPLELSTTEPSTSGIKVLSVWLQQNQEWWSGVVDEPHIRYGAGRVSALAYGCASALFTPSRPAKVVAKLVIHGHPDYLSAKPALLEQKS